MENAIRETALGVIRAEASAVDAMQQAITDDFASAVQLILDCPASLVMTGVGKAGHIARKLSATFSSTGTPSHFLSPTDAVHGDLGTVREGDVVMVLSASGESDEIVRILSIVKKLGHKVIAMTSSRTSSLGRHADHVLEMGKIEEACPLGLAPSASTTAMLALGDALALTVMKMRNFSAQDFAIYHPAGQLGRKLIHVGEAMTFKVGDNLPIISDRLTVREVLKEVSTVRRRAGAVVLAGADGKLSGIFTDGDLRRLLTNDPIHGLDRPMHEVMKRDPKRIKVDHLASEAMAIFQKYRIDELPVIDDQDRPVGLIDVQDLVVLRMLDIESDER